MTVIAVLGIIAAAWIAIAVLLALLIGRAVRIADRKQAAQMAMRPSRQPQLARAR